MKLTLLRVITVTTVVLTVLVHPRPGYAAHTPDPSDPGAEWTYFAWVSLDDNIWIAPFYLNPPRLGDAFTITDDGRQDEDESAQYRLLD